MGYSGTRHLGRAKFRAISVNKPSLVKLPCQQTLSLDRLIAPRPGEVETGVLENEARAFAVRFESEGHPPQLTAFLMSAPILASSVVVNCVSAKAVGHMAPSSRFASWVKPNVMYLSLNICAPRKKQTTLPSLAYAGIPYQVFGERAGALALMIAWSRSPMARSGCGSAAIFASTALSSSALSARRPPRESAFRSWRYSLIAARSSSVNPLELSPVAVALLGDFCVLFFAGFIVFSFPGMSWEDVKVVKRETE